MSKIYASTDNEDYLRVLRHFRKPGSMLAAILENLSDGIFITDANANVILINHAYEVISGLRKDEVLGKNMRDLEDQGVISRSATLIVLAGGKPVTIAQEFKTGRRTVVTSTPVLDGAGGIVMVVTNVRDVSELHYLKQELKKRSRLTQRYQSGIEYIERQAMDDADLIARDSTTIALLGLADRIARLDRAVLLLGETGVGKERFATYIFRRSRRSGERFIKVNCAAIAEGLIESELFGYVRGSFTGANPEGKMGLFEVADNGTIFLDEVGELPLNIQVKLLRALQEQEITRVGSDVSVRINVRILAATNRNLEEMVAAGTFREVLSVECFPPGHSSPAGTQRRYRRHRPQHPGAAEQKIQPAQNPCPRRPGTPARLSVAGQCAGIEEHCRARLHHERRSDRRGRRSRALRRRPQGRPPWRGAGCGFEDPA